jgi:hypothetical protein
VWRITLIIFVVVLFQQDIMENDFSLFRFYAFTRFKLGVSGKAVFDELQTAWGQQAPSYSAVKKWKLEHSHGTRLSFEDAPRTGRPSKTRTNDLVNSVNEIITDDPKLSTRDIALLLDVDHMTIHRILTENLLLRNVCSVWIPHLLSPAHKELRVNCAKGIRKRLNTLKDHRFNVYAVTDETWVPFDVELTKAENRVWIGKQEPRPQVVRPALTNRKTMLLTENEISTIKSCPYLS